MRHAYIGPHTRHRGAPFPLRVPCGATASTRTCARAVLLPGPSARRSIWCGATAPHPGDCKLPSLVYLHQARTTRVPRLGWAQARRTSHSKPGGVQLGRASKGKKKKNKAACRTSHSSVHGPAWYTDRWQAGTTWRHGACVCCSAVVRSGNGLVCGAPALCSLPCARDFALVVTRVTAPRVPAVRKLSKPCTSLSRAIASEHATAH